MSAASRIRVIPQALGANEGIYPFFVAGAFAGSSSLSDQDQQGPHERISVDVTTVDRYLDTHGIDTVELMNVILGAETAIRSGRIKVIQFEYNWRWIPFGHSLWEVYQFASKAGYRIGRLAAGGIEMHDRWHPELDRFIETNLVLIHPQALANLPHRVMEFDATNTAVVTA